MRSRGEALIALALLTVLPCGAQEPAAEIAMESEEPFLSSWQTPEECISQEDLIARVREQLSSDVEQRSIAGVIASDEGGWTATLTVFENSERLGERVLELGGDDCRSHDETLALVVALLLEHGPPQTEPERRPEEPVSPSPPEGAEEKATQPQEVPASTVQRKQPRLHAGAGITVLDGWAPEIVVAPSLRIGVLFDDRWGLELQGEFFPRRTADVATDGAVSASGGRGQMRGCYLLGSGDVRLPACLGMGWWFLSAKGERIDEPQRVFIGVPAVAGESGLRWNLSEHWALQGDLGLVFALKKAKYVFESSDGDIQVHETNQFLPTARVGLVLTF